MPPALTSTARAARLLRLYGWLTLIVLVVLLVAFGWPALREGQAVSPRNFDYLAVGIPAAALLFFAANKLSSGRQGNRYFAAALCVLMMFFFPIGTVLGAVALNYLIRGWSETAEPESAAGAHASPSAAGSGRGALVVLGLVLWNAVFIVCFVAAMVAIHRYADSRTAETVSLWLPTYASVWLLVLGARFSSRRASVVAIAVVASLLSLLQCGIFAFIVMLSAWNAEARSQAWFSLAAVAVAGTGLVWWYVAAKLSRHKLQA